MTPAFEQDVAWARIDAFVDGPRLHRPADRVNPSCRCNRPSARSETIENALPFLKTPEKQAVLKKVDDALTAMRKDGTLTKISENGSQRTSPANK